MELISKDDVIKALQKWNCRDYESLTINPYEVLRDIPIIQERKEGKWIFMDSDDMRYDSYRCSNCWNEITVDPKRVCDIGFVIEDFKYCPYCGARMQSNVNTTEYIVGVQSKGE